MSTKTCQSVVVLTGAGISAESGIQTFRTSDGLWENHRVEDVASPEGFARDPATVHQFYNERRRQLLDPGIVPNPAHIALAEFEQRFSGNFTLVTQNIDNLHERAGSSHVLHMHGELLKTRCSATGNIFDSHQNTASSIPCPCCDKIATLRPHVVWFGEMPLFMDEIHQALDQCDLFIAIGTSGHVYPAAGFFAIAKAAGAQTVELNLETSTNGSQFDECHQGPASILVPNYFRSL